MLLLFALLACTVDDTALDTANPDLDLDGDGVSARQDCDDSDAAVFPGAGEDCATGHDDDCDGSPDAVDAEGCVLFYADADGDGYGVGEPVCRCLPDAATPAHQDGDCDDSDASIHPGAEDQPRDGIDADCDGQDLV